MRGRQVVAWVASLGVLLLAARAQADWLTDLQAPFEEALRSGSWGPALGLAFVAGMATSLTPCVYPMIVITVSVFGARQAKSRVEGMLLSTSFVLGIAALFTPLGIVAALTGGIFGGDLLTSPIVGIVLALIFLALAASMFGAFELNLPPSLQNKLATVGGVGHKGAFALGLVSAVIAAPCTGPVLAVLLAWVGTSGNVALGGLALFVYALGLGLLFWLVGTFAVSLPKSGRWLEWVKSVFGVLMIVMALWYLRLLLPAGWLPHERATWWGVGAVVALIVGLGIGAVHLSYHDASTGKKVRKTLGIALAVAGLLGAVLWVRAMPPLPPDARMTWASDIDAARTLAAREGKPMLVDFGADWCEACGELDRHVFTDPRVVSQSRRFVTLRVDLSAHSVTPQKRELLASYNQRGLPLVVMHDSEGNEVHRVTGFLEAERFLQLMQEVD